MMRQADFPLLARHPELHYLDSAATAQKPRAVLDAVRSYYERANANPNRGAYALSVRATDAYEGARARVARFFGLADPRCLLFTRGTTEALNLLATAWGRSAVGAGDEIIVSRLEHHSNFVPWQQLALAQRAAFRIVELTPDGRIDLDHLRRLVTPRTKVIALAHVSNVLGTATPLDEIVAIARRVGALVVVDGAQGAPRLPVAFDALGIDAYAFSGHKMGAPMGIGGLLARRELLEAIPPYQMGGGQIEFVYDDRTTWAPLPQKFEAGTPNVGGAVGLAAAIDYVATIGMDTIARHERDLSIAATDVLEQIEGIRVFGPAAADRCGVIAFTLADVHPHDLATILDQDSVCIRAGHHCAQPLMRALGVPATARASFGIYNDAQDIVALVDGVRKAQALFGGVAEPVDAAAG
jgi:cysteine desulfurase / selenocysteine lyase